MRLLRRFSVVIAAVVAMTIGFAGPAVAAKAAVLHSSMTGANEVPGPGDPVAHGTTLIVLDAGTGRVCYVIKVTGISSPLLAAHIHAGAAGVAGPVVIPLPLTGGPNMFLGCTTADRMVVQSIIDNPSGFYTNVHNADFPAGAIRGQLSRRVPLG